MSCHSVFHFNTTVSGWYFFPEKRIAAMKETDRPADFDRLCQP
jgi:hypothetical protein